MKSNKLELDKYYTSQELADYCVSKTIGLLPDISEFIESSAGNGVFLNSIEKITRISYLAFDIQPEDNRIKNQDFIKLEIPYKEKRCVIGNPPFGERNNLSRIFCNKAFDIAEYVSFILPISQLNNTQSIYKYDLIYSEDLGKQVFSDRTVHCCFNIYKKPNNKKYNQKNNYKNLDIIDIFEIKEVIKNNNPKRNKELGTFQYDVKILAWGTASNNRKLGRFLDKDEDYAKTFYIKIKNEKHKTKIIELLKTANWEELYPMTATPNLLQWQVYKYINENL